MGVMYSNSWSSCGLVFSLYASCFVVGIFMWWPLLIWMVFVFSPIILIVFKEVISNKDCSNFYNCDSRPLAFWLFVLTEVIAFGTLFVVFLWFYEGEQPISSPSGYALAGSACLLTSSIWATAWHREVYRDLALDVPYFNAHNRVYDDVLRYGPPAGWKEGSSYSLLDSGVLLYPLPNDDRFSKSHFPLLFGTICFGAFFIYLQLLEFSSCSINLTDSSNYGSFYCTVGLHFMHVCFGLAGLSLYPILLGGSGVYYYSSLIVWYWHLVDYVWLWVYLIYYYL